MRTLAFCFALFVSIASASGPVHILTVNGSINPTTYEYLRNEIAAAEENGAQAVLVELNTPGGLLQSTRDIVTELLNAEVPVIVFVSPQGSRAASAGVFITMAAHVAAMAPGTNIGAAHPVDAQGGEMDSVMSGKVTNDAAAFIRSISEKRHRNVRWAEEAVRSSVAITENEALEQGVIDLVAEDRYALLDSLDGWMVVYEADTLVLATAGAELVERPMNWQYDILNLLSDPNISYILFLIGIYGLFFELYNPGSVFPGVAGAISIILALYSMQTLPINYAGLALIIVGIILFLLEIKVTSYGLLSIGGVIALFFGSIMLYRSDGPMEVVEVSLSVILPLVAMTAAFFFFVIGAGVKAQARKVTTGESAIVGAEAMTLGTLNPSGIVRLQGETWSAESVEGKIEKNVKVSVVEINGLLLKVRRKEQS